MPVSAIESGLFIAYSYPHRFIPAPIYTRTLLYPHLLIAGWLPGGNDIALRPTAATIASMASLLMMPVSAIESGWAPGLGHFKTLIKVSITI